jgi:ligand-binding sensor domain-containing protein
LLYGTNGGGIGIYDGYDFSSFKKKYGLSQNEVFSIDVGNTGEIWAATKTGINLLNKEVNRVKKIYQQEIAFYWVYVNKNTNDAWFGSAQGIYKYNTEKDTVEFFNSTNDLLNNSFINCIYSDADNRLWVGTKNAGVFVIDSTNKVTTII